MSTIVGDVNHSGRLFLRGDRVVSVIAKAGPPTTHPIGFPGQLYVDTANNATYQAIGSSWFRLDQRDHGTVRSASSPSAVENIFPNRSNVVNTKILGAGDGMISLGEGGLQAGDFSTISGGDDNWAQGAYSTISGGRGNTAMLGGDAVISGGQDNNAEGAHSSVGGGKDNDVGPYVYGSIGGGQGNRVSAIVGHIGGGSANIVDDQYGYVGGGLGNWVSAILGSIGGGRQNSVLGTYGMIPGGRFCTVDESFGRAGGSYARATAKGEHAHAGFRFVGDGDAQISHYILGKTSAGATANTLFTNGISSGEIQIPSGRAMQFKMTVIGREVSGNLAFAAEVRGLVVRNTGGTISQYGFSTTYWYRPLASYTITVDTSSAPTFRVVVNQPAGPSLSYKAWVRGNWAGYL